MGEFQPEAHWKGVLGCNLMALMPRSFSANACFKSFMVISFLLIVYICKDKDNVRFGKEKRGVIN